MSALADRQVLHRHDKAMSVIGRVDDEDARLALLEYVLGGNERIAEALTQISETRACTVYGCDRPRHALGHCAGHYARLRKHGDASRGDELRPYVRRIFTAAA